VYQAAFGKGRTLTIWYTSTGNVDVDKIFLFLLPIVFSCLAIFSTSDVAFFGCALVVALVIYELLTFKDRNVYGLNGLKILSMPSIIFFSFTVFIAVPAVYIASVGYGETKYYFYGSILLFYLFYPIGLLTANAFWRIDKVQIERLHHGGFRSSPADGIAYELVLVFFSMAILTVLLYLVRVEEIPLFVMLKNPYAYMILWTLREKSMKLLEVSFIEKYLFAWLREAIFPMGIVASLFLSMQYKERRYWMLFFLFFLLGLFNNSLTVAKAPVAALFLSLIGCYFLKKGKVEIKFIIGGIVLVFSFPYLVYYFSSNPFFRRPTFILNLIFSRVFIVPAEVLYQYFDIFPSKHEFLFGRSSHLFAWLYEDGVFNVANYVAKVWWGDPSTTGFANANYLGYFWADFGLLGVICSTFFIGFFINIMYQKLLLAADYSKNVVYVTVCSGMLMNLSFGFASSNFTSILLTSGLLLVFGGIIVYLQFFWMKKNPRGHEFEFVVDGKR